MHRHSLRPKEQLGSAEHERIAAAIKGVAQNHVNELVEEERRRVAAFPAYEIEIGRLQRLVAQQMVTKGDHQLPIFARFHVSDRSNVVGADAAAWIGE